MATTHWLQTQVVIDSTNEHLDFAAKYGGTYTDFTAHVPQGTYTSMQSLLTSIGAVMGTTDTAGTATYTAEQSGTTGKITISASGGSIQGMKLYCNVVGTTIWETIGFSTAGERIDESNPYSITSSYQAKHCWYMTRGPSSDTYDRPRIVGSELVVASSGIAERVTWSDQTTREMQWTVVPISKYLTRFAATNEAFEDIWEDMAHGYYVSYYTHNGATFTLEGKYALECEGTVALEGERHSPGSAYYSTPKMKLVRQS